MQPSFTQIAFGILLGVIWLPIAEALWVIAFVLSRLASPLLVRARPGLTRRMALKKELEAHFLPVLKAAGFTGPEEFKGNDHIFKFHRHVGQVHHFLDIQFDKWGGPKFRINFSEDTDAGINERLGAMRQARGMTAFDLLENLGGKKGGIVSPGRVPYFQGFLWLNTTGPYCWLRAVCSRRTPSEVLARHVAHLFCTELEEWWASGRAGTHLAITEHWSWPHDTGWRARLARCLLWLYCVYGFAVIPGLVFILFLTPLAAFFRWLVLLVVHWLKGS